MRWRDARDQSVVQRGSSPAHADERNAEATRNGSSRGEQPLIPPSPLYPGISTERIMKAVEQQRRVSQQLEDLRAQQKRRTARLRTTGLKCIATVCFALGVLATGFLVLLMIQPVMLEHTMAWLDDGIATLLMVEERLKLELSLIPGSSWLLSGAALVVVLMMGMWVRLMRYPREA
jgi:hypothetical protein